MNGKIQPHKSSIGDIDANIMSIIAYLGGGLLTFIPVLKYFSWAVPLVIFILEKKSAFVKKNAVQALILQLASSIIMFILYVIVGGIIRGRGVYNGNIYGYYNNLGGVFSGLAIIGTIATIVSILFGVVAIIAIIKAYGYENYSLPLIGNFTKGIEKKLEKVVNSSKETVVNKETKVETTEPKKADSNNDNEKK